MAKRNVQYMYYIFVTPLGKGYGCFAMRNTDAQGVYEVSSSFCHPNDRKLFRKEIARTSADSHRDAPKTRRLAVLASMGKAAKVLVNIAPDDRGNVDTAAVVDAAIKSGLEMRSWASTAYKRGAFYRTLSEDKKTWEDMVFELPNGRRILADLRDKYSSSLSELSYYR